jgi:ABC-type multidrug transport system fused ATPase/permease subunit
VRDGAGRFAPEAREGRMDRSIFRYIIRHSARAQVYILLLTVVSFPFLYATLELPKKIINDALGAAGIREVSGFTFNQVEYLFLLCSTFLVLVLINGAFKYYINVYKGIVGERMLRRLRFELFSRVLRFPLPHFRRVSAGEIVQMINAEVEPLGGYIGDAFALPAFQGGTLLTILVFMFMQDPVLGIAAIILYPFQIYVIPKLQARVNALGKERVRQVRRNADQIAEIVGGVRDIRANDATEYERARFSRELGKVFDIRVDIYNKKFFIKFLNNFMAQLAPFFFYSIGGYLVIQGELTLGALVAVIGAHEKLYAPWKELLTYYQMMYDVAIKFEQVVAQFDPPGLIEERRQSEDAEPIECRGDLRAVNLTLTTEENDVLLDGASFSVVLPAHIAIVGPTGSGKEELTLILANLLDPSAGRVMINDHEVQKLAEAITGRQIGYVGYPAQIFAGTIADNLLFGLKHRPLRALEPWSDGERIEAQRAGGSQYDPGADWIDYGAAGVDDPEAVTDAAVVALSQVGFDDDVHAMGLRGTIDPEGRPDLAGRFLEARRALRDRLQTDPRLGRLVEVFAPDAYNTNATLGENLLFGTPIGNELDLDHLAAHPYVRQILERAGLSHPLLDVGYRLADTMVELFQDLPPDHEYFRQFSFINADELPDYRALVSRADPNQLESLSPDDRERLISLTFKLIPARHRLDLVDEALQNHLLKARRLFRENLPAELTDAIAFFDAERYNPAASIQDNVLFGKIVYGQAQAQDRISGLIEEMLDQLDLRRSVIEVGLQAPTGVGGTRLSLPQRQKLALARALLKHPDVLVLYDPTSPLDPADQTRVLQSILEEFQGRTLIWAVSRSDWAERFDHVLVMRQGRVVEQGRYNELNRDGSAFHDLIAAE